MPATSLETKFPVQAVAVALLMLMAIMMYSSAWNDTITTDEMPHIAAGYSYLVMADSRLNPEHPPLMKDLAAIPLLFMNLRAPWEDKSWTEEINGQWKFGNLLLFDNDADAITRAAKAPMILFTLAFGWILFWWTCKEFGAAAALLTLFLYAFSPTFLAHGRLVTTDVGAAAGFFVGTIGLLRLLKNPTRRNVVLAGLAMAFAFLTKYSTFPLALIAVLLAVAWPLVQEERGARLRGMIRHLRLTAYVLGIALLAIYPVYLHHTWNFPPERQREYVELGISGQSQYKGAIHWASDKPVLRPWAAYLFGPIYVVQRAASDKNPRYFWGDIHYSGIPAYFPFVYLVKEPLSLHLMTLLALVAGLATVRWRSRQRDWLKRHFTECVFLLVIGLYWSATIVSSLNIGVRHVLPTFPFIYVLVASAVSGLHRRLRQTPVNDPLRSPSAVPALGPARLGAFRLLLSALLLWQAISVLRVHPAYLAYFNELTGGPDGGWRYVVDSNLDWGQDLKRLAQFMERRDIRQIHLHFFGSADPAYYLKEKYREISACSEPVKGWVAVSAMWYADSRRIPGCDYRRWLPMDRLVTKIGYSIFVFHID